jgi:hypothetical protein
MKYFYHEWREEQRLRVPSDDILAHDGREKAQEVDAVLDAGGSDPEGLAPKSLEGFVSGMETRYDGG